jgi:hypothetical protein
MIDDEKIKVSDNSTPDELRRAADQKEQEQRMNSAPGYPSWRYHPQKGAKLVHSPEEEEALGEGYSDVPDPNASTRPQNPELAALATETQALADRAASAAGVQSAHDRQRQESTNLLREATGQVQPVETATDVRRQQGQQENARLAGEKQEAQKLADYNKQEADKLASNVEGHPDSYRARKGAAKKAGGAKKTAGAAKAAKKATTRGKSGGRKRG